VALPAGADDGSTRTMVPVNVPAFALRNCPASPVSVTAAVAVVGGVTLKAFVAAAGGAMPRMSVFSLSCQPLLIVIVSFAPAVTFNV
jgi:hypothetical protein